MNIVIPDHIELDAAGRQKLEQLSNIKIYDDILNDPKIITKRIADAEIITANFIDLTAEIIKKSPKLKYIISPAVGHEWIDVTTATKFGVKVLNCPGFNSQAVAEHAIGLMFAVKRHLVAAHWSLLQGEFYPRQFDGSEVQGKLLVTVGYGHIGQKVIQMAKGLGMKVAWINSKTTSQEFDKLLCQADVLVLCLSLNSKTTGIIDKRRLGLLKNNAVLINIARGLLVDQEALFEALKSKKIAGAGLDTFPHDANITRAGEEILRFVRLPNVVATPHIAYRTAQSFARLSQVLIANIKSCLTNKPQNLVN